MQQLRIFFVEFVEFLEFVKLAEFVFLFFSHAHSGPYLGPSCLDRTRIKEQSIKHNPINGLKEFCILAPIAQVSYAGTLLTTLIFCVSRGA